MFTQPNRGPYKALIFPKMSTTLELRHFFDILPYVYSPFTLLPTFIITNWEPTVSPHLPHPHLKPVLTTTCSWWNSPLEFMLWYVSRQSVWRRHQESAGELGLHSADELKTSWFLFQDLENILTYSYHSKLHMFSRLLHWSYKYFKQCKHMCHHSRWNAMHCQYV